MIGTDRDAVICDLAETYHILDYKALPVDLLATLCSGLRDDSRIKMALAGTRLIPDILPLVRLADMVTVLIYGLSGNKAGTMPELYGDLMTGGHEKKETVSFTSPEEFKAAWKRMIGDNNG